MGRGAELTAPTAPSPAHATAPTSQPSLRRDLASAYAASAARVVSWALVSALVFRANAANFALLALVRGTIGLLNYTAVGLAPALVRFLAEAAAQRPDATRPPLSAAPVPPSGSAANTLSYATPTPRFRAPDQDDPTRALYANGLAVAAVAGVVGVAVTLLYAGAFPWLHRLPRSVTRGDAAALVITMGLATVWRLLSEVPGAVLQVRGRLALDNTLLAATDLVWLGLTASFQFLFAGLDPWAVGAWYLVANVFLLLCRSFAAGGEGDLRRPLAPLVRASTVRRLLGYGSLVAFAQVADFLYAPTDYILINRLLSPMDVATYAPAVQVDAALLLLVGALAAVLLPRAALAHAGGDVAAVKRYYVRGTLASAGLLAAAAALVWLASGWVFRLWLGRPMPATQAILPLVLIHTVVGGSSAVGRSVLLAMGKVKPFTASVLIAGVANVVLSFVLVKYTGLGLVGIVTGTVIVVVARCALWMPWYVMRTLNRPTVDDGESTIIEPAPAGATPVTPP